MKTFTRAVVTVAVVAATAMVPSTASAARDRGNDPLARFGTTERAQKDAASKVLREVQETRRNGGPEGRPSRDYTLQLRDLRLLRGKLDASDRKAADRLLARPTNLTAPTDDEGWPIGSVETKICSATVCVHYLTTGVDAATPTFANNALASATSVLQNYAAAGYRVPDSDATSANTGGDGKLDVYLSDIGPELYGYCTTDDPRALDPTYNPSANGYDFSAYCVIDNDYASDQFTGDPAELRDVTLAHELFHAVQFAYDGYEDPWIMEATATWVEDELYDDVNDNLGYIGMSPLSDPGHSLDRYEDSGYFDGYQYGVWTFFRFLTERFPTKQGALPVLVKNIWELADGSSANPDRDDKSSASIFAVQQALAEVDSRPFRTIFSEFAGRNRHPSDSYSEGSTWRQFLLAPRATYTLTTSRRGYDFVSVKLQQLSSQTLQYNPSGLSTSNWKLRLDVVAPPTYRGSAARALVYRKDGTIKTYGITLSSAGKGSVSLPFSSSTVSRAQLVLSNASLRYTCWATVDDFAYRSCAGTPLDHNLTFKYKAVAYR